MRSGMVMRMTMNAPQSYVTPWVEKTLPRGKMSGTGCGLAFFQMRPMFWRRNEKPIAVISGASRGWLRRGL
jgi:hypothetical protein